VKLENQMATEKNPFPVAVDPVLADLDNQLVAKVAGKMVSRGELNAVFRKVENPENWKLPIDCFVALEAEEKLLLEKAITFFTGSIPSFQVIHEGCQIYRVKAAGYYAAVGA